MSNTVATFEQLAEVGQLVGSLREQGRLIRHNDETEVEVKFAVDDERTDPADILSDVVSGLVDESVLIDHVRDGQTVAYPSYQTADDVEYSSFIYDGQLHIKIKKHSVAKSADLPIMVSSERFLIGESAVEWLAVNSTQAVGQLEKHRAKAFVVDQNSETVFSIAVTVCLHKKAVQRQVEVEYYASLDGTMPRNVQSLVGLVADMGRVISRNSALALAPTTETKFEFLTNALGS
ncbi:hypothetical protein [Paenarthrobacter nicotinovorans]|uniref:hypothetical protein n=1 Tax=Paenarthrobacter nicotinovorans TaxID=29320 RepID=UPI003D67ABEF